MSELNDYAKQLLSRRPRGRVKGSHRGGSVLAGKNQTQWEATVTSGTLARNKKRWDELFAKPLNKWKHHP
jgi:hypothetical protein